MIWKPGRRKRVLSLTMAIEPKVTPKTRNTARVIPRGEETMGLISPLSRTDRGDLVTGSKLV